MGIPTIADRVVQAALKLMLEPIFEADFLPVSYGFRPMRRAHDAIAEIHMFGTRGYRWVLDADIEACFDSIDHTALMDRVRRRVKDKRVLALVKAFLKAGVLTEHDGRREHRHRNPAGRHPVPAAGQHRAAGARRARDGPWKPGGTMGTTCRRHDAARKGLPTWRIVRYADDFVVLVHGQRHDVEPCARTSPRCCTTGSAAFTSQDPGGAHERRVRLPRLPHPVETQERHEPVVRLHLHRRSAHQGGKGQDPCPDPQDVPAEPMGRLIRLNQIMRGWANYFRHAVASTPCTPGHFACWRIIRWLRKRHRWQWKDFRR